MSGIKNIKLFNTFKNEFNKLIKEGEDTDSDKFYRTFSRKDIYKILMDKYLKKKEVSDITFRSYGINKNINEDAKDHGDIDNDYSFNEYYINETDNFRYPDYWRFRTDDSKIYNEFIEDIYFLKGIGILKNYKIKKGTSSKSEFEKGGFNKYESSGTHTKNSTDIELMDNLLDDFE